jgi:glycosyltransferase involved in cell wall biosynthesis
MTDWNRPLVDRLIRPLAQTPVLTVVIPTFHRPKELTVAIASIADQLDATLDGKVEIIVSDNGSGLEKHALLKQLAAQYPSLSYYMHLNNEGGPFQICSAPHRARGRWTWVFGDDDALEAGGLAPIIDILEREQPGFLTLNRQVWNKTLDRRMAATKHDLPDIRFDSFLDLLTLFGFDQLSFLTSQIYATDVARNVDADPYLASPCRYCQLAYYLEAFHDQTAYYSSRPSVWHRWDQGATEVHAANFRDLATAHPELVQLAADRVGLQPGLFERINGRRSMLGPEIRKITFVDNILENLWRCVALGTFIPEEEWDVLAGLAPQWAPQRAEQLAMVHDVYAKVHNAFQQYQTLVADYKARVPVGAVFTPPEIDLLKKSEAAILSLQGEINEARKVALELSGGFN